MYEVPITQRASAAAAHGKGCLPQMVWCSQSDRRGTSWLYYSLRLGAVSGGEEDGSVRRVLRRLPYQRDVRCKGGLPKLYYVFMTSKVGEEDEYMCREFP